MARKVNFIDVTLRDGQQSIAATRMTTPQAMRVLKMIDRAGFSCMELWGGAVLDSCIRFLGEDPWERLETFRDALGGSQKIRALLRGQNLFGYRPQPDDLVLAFVKQAVESGVGVMRIFDALNDWRNIQVPLLATKAYGARAEACLSYTVSPVHTVEHFVDFAVMLQREGADQIAIKDMAGLLYPTAARDLFRGLKKNISLPLVLHSHATTGVALVNCILAMQAGIDYIDTCITPFAGGCSLPAVEVLMVFAEEMGLDHGLDRDLVLEIQKELFWIYEELKDFSAYNGSHYRPVHYDDVNRHLVHQIIDLTAQGDNRSIDEAVALSRTLMKGLRYPEYDDSIFTSQIPGGMLSNLRSQLKEMGRLDLMEDVMAAIPQVRKDAGYVPLVTPTSQIIGAQAVFNLLFGAYEMVTEEFKMLLRGEFGRTPAPVNPAVLRKVLDPSEPVYKYRPAAYLTPVLEDRCWLPFVRSHKDLLLHLGFDQAADGFLKFKYPHYVEELEELECCGAI
jgi:pyruvate/oxaloacetate carboxyltransferase